MSNLEHELWRIGTATLGCAESQKLASAKAWRLMRGSNAYVCLFSASQSNHSSTWCLLHIPCHLLMIFIRFRNYWAHLPKGSTRCLSAPGVESLRLHLLQNYDQNVLKLLGGPKGHVPFVQTGNRTQVNATTTHY